MLNVKSLFLFSSLSGIFFLPSSSFASENASVDLKTNQRVTHVIQESVAKSPENDSLILPIKLVNKELDSYDPKALEELIKILREEKGNRGTFIKKIRQDLKACTDGKMIELSFMLIKAAYWWDSNPLNLGLLDTKDILNGQKELIIDYKFRSSFYDRTKQNYTDYNLFEKFQIDFSRLSNSWEATRNKKKFFENEDIEPNNIPEILKDILGYGVTNFLEETGSLDTFPSVTQLIRVSKTLKYKDKISKDFACSPESIASQNLSTVILEGVNEILAQPYYRRFRNQNHPLNRIIENHLEKLKIKADKNDFMPHNKERHDHSPSLLTYKILQHMQNLIRLISVFDLDIDSGICNVPESQEWGKDKPRNPYYLYYQLYEVFNDLTFLLTSISTSYTQQDFNTFLTNAYVSRFPIFEELRKDKNIIVESFPARSGMEAIVNAFMAIGHIPDTFSIGQKVGDLKNDVYYEIDHLARTSLNRKAVKVLVFPKEHLTLKERDELPDKILKSYISEKINENIVPSSNLKFRSKLRDHEKFENSVRDALRDNLYLKESRLKLVVDDETVDQIKTEMADNIFKKVKENITGNDFISLKTTKEGKFYFEFPKTMEEYQNQLRELFPNSIERIYMIDQNPSIISGLTPDTIDFNPDDKNFIENLYLRIKNIKNLKQEVAQASKPFIFVWDTTVEVDQGPCYNLMHEFQKEIQSGEVVFLLCKSLQKYASLGVAKSKAGVITLVGNKSASGIEHIASQLKAYGEDVFKHSQDYALMTFFYDTISNRDNEKLYYQAVRKRAQKIHSENSDKFEISGGCLFTEDEKLKDKYNIPFSDTFGLALTTELEISLDPSKQKIFRYSVGLNPKGL